MRGKHQQSLPDLPDAIEVTLNEPAGFTTQIRTQAYIVACGRNGGCVISPSGSSGVMAGIALFASVWNYPAVRGRRVSLYVTEQTGDERRATETYHTFDSVGKARTWADGPGRRAARSSLSKWTINVSR